MPKARAISTGDKDPRKEAAVQSTQESMDGEEAVT